MQTESWKNIERIFNAAVALPQAERKEYVHSACGNDLKLREEISAMLAEDAASDDFLSGSLFSDGLALLENESLFEQSDLGSYKLQKLLGRGGMGAVYLAEDVRLGRLAAIKVLPPALAEDEQSLARFRREARAASALSHPNIAHIYEFGEADGRMFLAMEYVEGKTARELIRDKELTAPLALSIAKQTALALMTTHERGLIHRDIKPENIIVKPDGLVKILDFGLAKLHERSAEVADDAAVNQIDTQAGMILGTVGYMSPEHIRGKRLDAATDLWSLGVVLFEMLTGARPFQGETPSDVQAAILKDEPRALNDFGALTPIISEIVKKSLAKNVAERYRTAQEFAEDIERLQLQFDANFHDSHRYFAVTKSAEYAVRNPPEALAASGSAKFRRARLILPAVFLLTAFVGFLMYHFGFNRQAFFTENQTPPRVTRLTNSGNVLRAAVSSDGQNVAYILDENGSRGIFLRRRGAAKTFSAQAVTVLAPSAERQIRGVGFAADGQEIYFRAKSPQDAAFHLYKVAVEGGEPRKIADNAQSMPSFSPDGKQMVFLRTNQDNSRGDLIIADADGAHERVFYTRQSPEFFSHQAQPAWSPDGATILCSTATRAGNREQMIPMLIRVSDARAEPVFAEPWSQIWTTEWENGGKSFVMTGRPDRSTDNNQLWRVALPNGEITRLTHDFNDYYGVSAARADGAGSELTSVILNRTARLWLIDLNGGAAAENARQMTEAGGDDGYGVSWANDGKIFYGSSAAGNPDIWKMNADGSERRQLTIDTHLDSQPTAAPDNRRVVFGSLRSGIESLWRMNADGSEQTLLVSDAVREPLAITPDGTVFYHSTNGGAALWRVSIEGGQPEKIIVGKYYPSAVSPDSNLLAAAIRPDGAKANSLAVFSIEDNSVRPLKEFKFADGADFPGWLRFTPDGNSIAYVVTRKGVGNLWSQPLTGGEPVQLTNFTADRIYSFAFSPDGKQIICARGILSGYAVTLANP